MASVGERTAEEIMEALMEGGPQATTAEVAALCAAAMAAGQLEAELDGLKRAMQELGYTVIDVTTDDDGDQRVLQIVRPEEP